MSFGTLIVILLVVALAVAGVLVWRRRSADRRSRETKERKERISSLESPGAGLRALRTGDVVGMDGGMWLVEGSLRFDEDGFAWQEHLVVDGEQRTWLSVEDDEGVLEVVRWERLRGHGLSPDGDAVVHDGVSYALEERGRASFRSEGATGAPSGGRMEYADYNAGGGTRRLGFERYSESGSWEASLGTEVSEHALDVYPGERSGAASA